MQSRDGGTGRQQHMEHLYHNVVEEGRWAMKGIYMFGIGELKSSCLMTFFSPLGRSRRNVVRR